ncbi:MAG: hypothetical protein Aurels2KO_05890 [Aureliella sp.]
MTPASSTLDAAGGTVTMTVSMSGDASEVLNSYDLFFDISGVDLNDTATTSPVTLSNFQSLTAPGFGDLFDSINPGGGGRDFGVSNADLTGDTLGLTGGQNLFSFDATFAANATATDVVYNFAFTPAVNGFEVQINGAAFDVGTITYNNAAVTVSAVPEPSSMGLAALAIGAVALRRRRV